MRSRKPPEPPEPSKPSEPSGPSELSKPAEPPTLLKPPRVPPRLVTALRLLLFVVFAGYGSIKLLGGQYDYGDWVISNRTSDGTSVVWAFYGYSPVYGRFTGLYELVPALMLLSRRTVTLGAMALFAVSLNITVMDFAYGYPSVKYFSLAYTFLCLLLVVQDRDRLLAAFWHGSPPGGKGGKGADDGGKAG